LGVTPCDHGYAALDDCPRCAPRAAPTVTPPRVERGATRWHATVTTLGPVAKLAITIPMLFVTLMLAIHLSEAGAHLEYAFAAVPLGAMLVLDVAFLPQLWEIGHRRGSR
jgi:hypothetical protein